MRISTLLIAALTLLTSASTGALAATTYTYDTLGRLSTVTYDNGETIVYTYDAAGNRTQVVISP
jgi:YD repeat-containing protein